MTKHEAIQKAYGQYWETVNNYVDHDGWLDYDVWFRHIGHKIDYDMIPNEIEKCMRPKSLQGIENNNGWIKIESEEDLPKKGASCHFILKTDIQGIFVDINDSEHLTLLNRATHYQPIDKPKPPIY